VPASEEESEEGEEGSEEEESGHKRSLNAILKLLYEQGADPDRIMDEIKDIVVKTLIVGQPYMSHIYRSCQPEDYDNSMCFQILGFDIMIDKYFKPWLIEVNQSPSFATDSPLDYEVKKAVLRDAFRLLDVGQERREKFILMKQKQMAERILTGKQDKLDPE
jgi:tubulin polyglutamylase TTLL6/13